MPSIEIDAEQPRRESSDALESPSLGPRLHPHTRRASRSLFATPLLDPSAIAALLAGLAVVACSPAPQMTTRDEGRLGSVRLFASEDSTDGLTFLFSDADGWTDAWTDAATELAGEGTLVVGVDLPSYLRGLRASDDGCHYLIAEIEDLSHRLEREHGFDRFRAPILAGVGAGGTLAYAALAQSPAATVDGAISVDPTPILATRVSLCPGAVADPEPGGGFRYEARTDLPGYWWVSPLSALSTPLAAIAKEPSVDVEPEDAASNRLVALVLEAVERSTGGEASLEDLPLIELPISGSPTQMAVLYSGDGGWRDLDKDIAGVLAREGTPVVGVDSLRYFWREKTPEEVSSELARILRHFRSRWRVQRVLLVGYSFGADILPFAAAGLPSDLREDVAQISLLGLASHAPFEISVTGWLGSERQGRPVLPVLRSLDLTRVQCIYGEDEDDSLCPSSELEGIERIRTSGGHHFDGDYEKLAREILDGAARRSAGRAPAKSG